MSKPTLETFVAASDTLVRIFSILAALCAAAYFFSNRQLHTIQKETAEKTRLEAEKQRQQLEAEVSAAQSKVATLEADNTRLNTEIEKQRQTELKILGRYGPRGVSPEAAAAMAGILGPFAGQKIQFAYFMDLETAAFAEHILDSFRAAGWKPQVFKLKTLQPMYGVACGGAQAPALNALVEALSLTDKHVSSLDPDAAAMMRSLQPQAPDSLWVLVGLKRPYLHTADNLRRVNEDRNAAADRH